MRRLLLLRGIFAFVLAVLAVVAFASGEEILGALLTAFAITQAILVSVFTWHQVRNAGRPSAPPARRPN